MSTSPSYDPNSCCRDTDCRYLDLYPDEPCWGPVEVVDEEYSGDDYWFVHICRGHESSYCGKKYKPEPKP